MSRTLHADTLAQIQAQSNVLFAWLIELTYSGGTVYFAIAPRDLDWNGQTYTALGGTLNFDLVRESADVSDQGINLTLSAVDRAITGVLMTNDFVGYDAYVRLVYYDPDDGTVQGDPISFRYQQEAEYTAAISKPDDPEAVPTATVQTRLSSPLSEMSQYGGTRTNVDSHQRTVPAAAAAGDLFFDKIPEIQGKPVWWGDRPPDFTKAHSLKSSYWKEGG
jgi:hypothetical protein